MCDFETEALVGMAKALTPEQICIILDNIPIDYVYAKIGKTLKKNENFEKAVRGTIDILA